MYKKQLVFFTSLLIIISAFFFGCDKNENNAGIVVIPDNYRLSTGSVDTFRVKAHTYKVDTLPTSGVSKVLLGVYQDPLLGELKASFVTEIIPSSVSQTASIFSDTTIIDSLVMYLRLDTTDLKTYGNEKADCEIDVMKINKELDFYKQYYHNVTITDLSPEIKQSFTLNPETIVKEAEKVSDNEYERLVEEAIGDETDQEAIDSIRNSIERPDTIPLLKLKFNDQFCQDIYSWLEEARDTTFVRLFNGFLFTPASGASNAAISSFYHNSAGSKISLYYHYENDDEGTAREYGFSLSTATRFNIFEHDHNIGGFLPNLVNPESQEDSVVYIQGAGGLRAKIQFPYLDQIKEQGNFGVSRAELIIPVEDESITEEGNYPAPKSLILLSIINEEGDLGIMDEFNADDYYQGVTYNDNKYTFDITYWAQKVIKGELNNDGLMLLVQNESVNPSRVILTSGKHSNRIKLVLTLTDL